MHWAGMLYQNTEKVRGFSHKNYYSFSSVTEIKQRHASLLRQKIVCRQRRKEQFYLLSKLEKNKLKSKNSIWDTVKLLERFQKPEYKSKQAKIELLRADAIHHAKEMALIEPITKFSYWHTVETNKTTGDGYFEDVGLMLNTFTQDIAQKGLNASRASIEAITFEKARHALTSIAIQAAQNDQQIPKSQGVLITSFPDETKSGYHGVDSKYNWDKPETHHSFFYLLRVGEIETNQAGVVIRFKIETTQYRSWPNARQALQTHQRLNSPITITNESVPNLLFANLIHLDTEKLKTISQKLGVHTVSNSMDEFEQLLKEILFMDSEQHAINHTQLPEVDPEVFWQIQNEYFNDFYLDIALHVFEEIDQLKSQNKTDSQAQRKIQVKIEYLDKAFFYYSKILLGWIKINNQNPLYEKGFNEKNQIQKLITLQKKLLFGVLGMQQNQSIPSVSELKIVLDIDHRLSTKNAVSNEEKRKLLKVWGFFSFVGNFGSLLQCGTIAPFSLPISIMNKSFSVGTSLTDFSGSLANVSIPEKQLFLQYLQEEKYVELDLTQQQPPAKKIYTVPKSYLEGEGCIVAEDGTVLGPCVDPKTNLRISLDDPRDTLAFPMSLLEFNQYISTLQKNIEMTTVSEIDKLFQSNVFSLEEKRKTQITIKKLKQKLLKKSLDLQDFISGDLTNNQFISNNEWLKTLVIKLSFSQNPVQTLIEEVETKIKENDPTMSEIVEQIE